jgi:hypothetical protein
MTDPMFPPGPGVDAQGRPVIDPTRNVLGLVEAAVKRLDDLADLRSAYDRRLGEQRLYYEDKMRELDKELRKAESDRIDAIRAVDVGNVQRAAEVAGAQAEALRTTVAATATAFDAKIVAVLDPIQKDIADLRRAQYEAQGQKTQVVETQARGGSTGMWIGVAVAAGSLVLALVAIAVTVAVILNGNP